MTPIFNLSADDMTARYDYRMLARLCFDDDVKHEKTDLANSEILDAALLDAEGELRAALSVAGMYDLTRFSKFTPESVALAKRIMCEIALAFLYGRRGGEARETIEKIRASSEEYLDRLRKGERLFSLVKDDSKEKAGQPELVEPTRVQLQYQNGIAHRARVYFGGVGGRLRKKNQ